MTDLVNTHIIQPLMMSKRITRKQLVIRNEIINKGIATALSLTLEVTLPLSLTNIFLEIYS